MVKENIKNLKNIELRSDKVRKILGSIPVGLLYWGSIIIIFIFIVLLSVVFFVEFPYGNGETIFEHIFTSIY